MQNIHEIDPKIRSYASERIAAQAARLRQGAPSVPRSEFARQWFFTDRLAVSMAKTPADLALIVLVHCDFGRADPSPYLFSLLAEKAEPILRSVFSSMGSPATSDCRYVPESFENVTTPSLFCAPSSSSIGH